MTLIFYLPCFPFSFLEYKSVNVAFSSNSQGLRIQPKLYVLKIIQEISENICLDYFGNKCDQYFYENSKNSEVNMTK